MQKTEDGFSKKFSLKALGKKDVERLDIFLRKAGYGAVDYRILEFENNAEIKIFNKTLFKEIRSMAAFLVSNAEIVHRVVKIRLRTAEK